jgi:hypothetical protein
VGEREPVRPVLRAAKQPSFIRYQLSAERSSLSFGGLRTVSNPGTRRSSLKRFSPLRVQKCGRRFIAGADAVATADQVVAELKSQIRAFRDLSLSLAFDAVKK